MFAEIRKDYLTGGARTPLPFLLCGIGGSPDQRPMNRPEGFSYHHVIWVTRGTGLFRVKGETRILRAGEGLFCRKNVPHSYERAGIEFDTQWITFLGAEGVLDYYSAGEAFFFQATAAFSTAAMNLDALCMGASTILSRSAAGYNWLVEWLEAQFAPSISTAAKVRQFLEAHFAEPLTLDEIAAQVNMNRFQLCRYYGQEQGLTVMEQLKRVRIAKAKQFLRYTSCSIETVGRMCGYESASYFGKLFREETGRTPREYRDAHNG